MNKTKFNEFTENKIKEIYSNIDNSNRFILLRGTIGVGKTLIAKELSKRIVNKNSDNNDFNKYISIVPFHPGSDYENVIYGLKLTTANGNLEYNATERILLNAISKAENDSNNNYVVILDDVNRGDFSRAMGDVLSAVEAKDIGNAVRTPKYSYTIPDNFYLIATFNPTIGNPNIDYAWLRRFMIFDIFSDERYIDDVNNIIERNKCENFFSETDKDKFTDYIFELYMQIKILFERYFLDDDVNIIKQYMPGHGLFMTYDDNKDYAENARKFSYQLRYCIVPLLYQYVKDGLFDTRALLDIKAYEHLYDEDFKECWKDEDLGELTSDINSTAGENTTTINSVYLLMKELIIFKHMPQAASFKFFFQNVSMMRNFKTYLFETEDIKIDRNNKIDGLLAKRSAIKIMDKEFYFPGLLSRSKNKDNTPPQQPYSPFGGKIYKSGQFSPDLVYQLLIKWFLRSYEFNCYVNGRDYNENKIINKLLNNNNIANEKSDIKSDILKYKLQENKNSHQGCKRY